MTIIINDEFKKKVIQSTSSWMYILSPKHFVSERPPCVHAYMCVWYEALSDVCLCVIFNLQSPSSHKKVYFTFLADVSRNIMPTATSLYFYFGLLDRLDE